MEKIIKVMNEIEELLSARVYLTGGALCEHKTRDYDIAIFTERVPAAPVLRDRFEVSEIHQNYKEDTNFSTKFHTCIKIMADGLKIDLLFVDHNKVKCIEDLVSMFPLSIQMKYMGTDGIIRKGTGYCSNPIVVYRPEQKNCLSKYLTYYPDTPFKTLEALIN